MTASAFSWLHLTDFHYGLKGQDCLWPTLREPFLDSLADLHERCGPWDAVLFTGDLVQSGETAQFEKMQAEVLDPLWGKLREFGSGDAVLLHLVRSYGHLRKAMEVEDAGRREIRNVGAAAETPPRSVMLSGVANPNGEATTHGSGRAASSSTKNGFGLPRSDLARGDSMPSAGDVTRSPWPSQGVVQDL